MPEKLYLLFQSFGTNYREVFQNVAIDLLTEETTKFTANNFFWDRVKIKNDFETVKNKLYK
jgi:hypothetical protein